MSKNERGYTSSHQRLRAQFKPLVQTGQMVCPRCHNPILPGQAWDLGHTGDRAGWTGPEHALCNRRAAGLLSHQATATAGATHKARVLPDPA